MGIARSTYYDEPKGAADDTALVEAMHAIKDEFEAFGWRRMQAALKHRGWVVNHKKIKRLMREHALHPPRRRRFVATTDSDHDEAVFPDLSGEREVDGPNRLWVADPTCIAVLGGFVYLAAIMDAWSRRIVGYTLGRRIDARLTLAALTAAIELRNPTPGCIHHSDRGSQYAAQAYRALLNEHGLVGSMGRRGNPYDNAMKESFMKTLKVNPAWFAPALAPCRLWVQGHNSNGPHYVRARLDRFSSCQRHHRLPPKAAARSLRFNVPPIPSCDGPKKAPVTIPASPPV